MELCDGGSLYDLKEAKKDSFSERELSSIMAFRYVFIIVAMLKLSFQYCLPSALGLAHLHSQMSIHRVIHCHIHQSNVFINFCYQDVKSANILLTRNGCAKLGGSRLLLT